MVVVTNSNHMFSAANSNHVHSVSKGVEERSKYFGAALPTSGVDPEFV